MKKNNKFLKAYNFYGIYLSIYLSFTSISFLNDSI